MLMLHVHHDKLSLTSPFYMSLSTSRYCGFGFKMSLEMSLNVLHYFNKILSFQQFLSFADFSVTVGTLYVVKTSLVCRKQDLNTAS